jgi:uncharacterized protein RhaS with RHS repeats
MYNYGYRDYQPEVARFTTIDPIRDGANWFAYVNNDPVNWVDLWGLACSASDYLARGIALVKEGAGKLVAGSVLGSLGEILISGILISDANSKIAEGAQQYTIGTILSEKTLTDKGNVDNYVSPAKGYDAALADFYAINPSNIKIDDKNGTIHGDLLDGTHINVRDHSTYTDDHRPTVEIFISKNYKIKIRY